jgi:hypothetical protein
MHGNLVSDCDTNHGYHAQTQHEDKPVLHSGTPVDRILS